MFDFRGRIEALVSSPGRELGRGAQFLRTQIDLWRFCARRLSEHNLGAMSAALSFRTIFALIPTLVLAFLVMKSMGVIEDGKRALRNFLESSGFASVAIERGGTEDGAQPQLVTAADQIASLVDDVEAQLTFARIGPIGAVVLIWTAMTLLTTLEASLNRVFGAPRARGIHERVVMFWSAITLGPILIMAAVFAGRGAIEAAGNLPGIGWLAATIGWLTPAFVGILVVAAGYKLIPNTHVRFKAAIGGAIVAVPAWMVARWAFAIYVERFVLEGNLYGVLGLLPLFLIWLNVSWSIFLFGAELAHTAANLAQLRRGETAEHLIVGPSDWLAIAVALGRRFEDGLPAATQVDLVEQTELPPEVVGRVLERLIETELVVQTVAGDEPRYLFARPTDQIPLLAIVDEADPRQANPIQPDPAGLRKIVAEAQGAARAELAQQTLADLCRGPAEDRPRTLQLP